MVSGMHIPSGAPIPLLTALRRKLFLYCVLVPSAILSREFREQLRLVRRYFPQIRIRIRLLKYRNWGSDLSLTLTDFFPVPIDSVLPNDHPEIIAFLGTETDVENHLAEQVRNGILTQEVAEKRRLLTPRLLKQDPRDLFSEVRVDEGGRLRICDGHHRAGVARAFGRSVHNVVVTVKVNLT